MNKQGNNICKMQANIKMEEYKFKYKINSTLYKK